MVALDEPLSGAAHAEHRLRSDEMIWLTTVPGGRPAADVGGVFHWDGTDFLPVSQPTAAQLRDIAGDPRVSLNLNGTEHGADLLVVEGMAEVVPDHASGPWPERARIDAHYARYERALRDVLNATAAEMAAAIGTALRVTPTRWRVNP